VAGHELAPFVQDPGDRLLLLGLKERVANLEARVQELTVERSEYLNG
jgi:hypothetical protein